MADELLEGKLLPMLYVCSLPRSVEFYRDKLGFEFRGWWGDSAHAYVPELPAGEAPVFAELLAGDLVLHLHLTESKEDGGTAAPAAILHVRVKDADAYYERVVASGGTCDPPQDQPWGWRQFYVRDPDGHQWSFYNPTREGGGGG